MAFDQATRGRLQRFVNDVRRVLEEEFTRQLQNDYGLDPSAGTVAALASLRHINDAQRETARILRDTLAHYTAGGDMNTSQGLDRVVREQAFTVLNRLAALRMVEARGLLVESVSSGMQAKGFQLYVRLVGTGLGETGDAYRTYLFSVFDEFAQDLPGLFDRYSPQGRLFPREAALLQVLSFINDGDIAPLWSEDETIGWMYQYFNSKEERKAMRDASQAPRNSRELAVRNQFFTPRYVVEFLVDNTLGRLWFNATGGQTGLRERCQYLLVRPDERPLAPARLRDPRTLKLLDPACGSMHFGLYAFDLFLTIYREAWEWEQTHGPGCLDIGTQPIAGLQPLCHTYASRQTYLRDVPRLIIEHNIYGVDIDSRAAQIASLALWLRAQRAWHEDGVKAKDRPALGTGHVIAATAPPAEKGLLEQFAAQLDRLDAELFTETLKLLKGVPEMGALLQVELELSRLVRSVFGEHGSLFKDADVEQWRKAEGRLRAALTEFAQAATATYQGRLFAQDALQGLRLIDLSREVFDVVVMNPPFGEAPETARSYIKEAYSDWADNLYVAFHNRASMLLAKNGLVGAITSRTFIASRDFEAFRRSLIVERGIRALADLGWGVLDGAQVETCAYVTSKDSRGAIACGPFIRLLDVPVDEKRDQLISARREARGTYRDVQDFLKLPGAPLCYWSSKAFVEAAELATPLYPDLAYVGQGASPHAFFFRAWWEVPIEEIGSRWKRIARGGDFSPFFRSNALVIDWWQNGAGVKEHILKVYPYLNGNYGWKIQDEAYYERPGITWGKRNERFNAQALPSGHIFTDEGQGIVPNDQADTLFLLGYLNSSFVSYFLSLTSGLQKHYVYIRQIPIPTIDASARDAIAQAASRIIECKRRWNATSELSPEFSPAQVLAGAPRTSLDGLSQFVLERHAADCAQVERDREMIDKVACQSVALGPEDLAEIAGLRSSWPIDRLSTDGLLCSESAPPTLELAKAICSFAMGVAVGRWRSSGFFDDNLVVGASGLESIASCPPAMDLGIGPTSKGFAGVISSGKGSGSHLGRTVRGVLSTLWGASADVVEQEIVAALKVSALEEYFDRASGFFDDHLNRYSKSRRKAPIYWPLSTKSGSYILWIYYQSLTSQTLYTAINDLLEPKLKQVGGDLAVLRSKGSTRTREDERRFEELQAFEIELVELRDSLLSVAPTYKPNKADGVQISAAPLWQLFRHKPWQNVLKEVWSKLAKGEYEWAQLAMNYWPDRVLERCATDKSIAIAHGLESLYVAPEVAPKRTRSKKKGAEE